MTDAELVLPIIQGLHGLVHNLGLTKRELFAAMAMQGFCAVGGAWGSDTESAAAARARMAVENADALLAELAKPKAVE